MEETKTLICTLCGSYHLEKFNNEELKCSSCGGIIKLSKSIEFEKIYKKLQQENKDVDIKNKRKLVSNSLTPSIKKDDLIRYSQAILEIIPEDVLSTFYIKFANKKNNPREYEMYLEKLPKVATKTELDEIINLIIDNAILREEECIKNILNNIYKDKQDYYNRLKEVIMKDKEKADLYTDIKRDIFICHQSSDKEVVDEILKALEDDGYVCWISNRNIPKDSDNYWLKIEEAIKSCDIFLCISSKNTLQSQECIREVELAAKHNKTKRIEYKIDDSKDITLFKNFFTGQWIQNLDALLDKVYNLKHKESTLYEEAKNYLSEHNYSNAKRIFNEILDYEDSKEYIDVCTICINIKSKIQTGLFKDAKTEFSKLLTYNDNEYLQIIINELQDNMLEYELKIANKYILLNSYDKAKEIYEELLISHIKSFKVWYGYLYAITKGFVDNSNKKLKEFYQKTYELANEDEKLKLEKRCKSLLFKEDIYIKKNNYIYFGKYPQTIKDESVKIVNKIENTNYYLGSDGEKYVKVKANPYDENYTFSNGERVLQGNNYYFKVEPVKWKILYDDNEEAFLFCDNILNVYWFDSSSNNYQNSSIKRYLNDAMLKDIFNTKQMSIIMNNEMFGKLFLLSDDEIINKDDNFRQIVVTDYAIAIGILYNSYGNLKTGKYWLRTSKYECDAVYVNYKGNINNFDFVGNDFGIVPALKIKL